jgi:hypothetical protein
MRCEACGWKGSFGEVVVEEREKTLLGSAMGLFFAYPRKKRFFCPRCHEQLWSQFSDGPLAGR